jgi:hypothetical protein
MSTPPRLLKKLYDVLLGSPPATRADLLAAYDKWEKDELPMALALFFMHTGKVFFMAKASDSAPLTKEVIVTALRADLRLQTHHLASALFKRAVLYGGKVSRVMMLLGAALAHDDGNALKAQLYGAVLGVWATRRTGAVRDEVDKLVLSLEWLVDSSKLVFASGKEDALQRVALLLPPNFASVAPFTSKEQFQKKLRETMAKHLTDAFSKELVPIAMQLGHALMLQKEPLLDLQGWPDSSEYSGSDLLLLHASERLFCSSMTRVTAPLPITADMLQAASAMLALANSEEEEELPKKKARMTNNSMSAGMP